MAKKKLYKKQMNGIW